jgi:hypothetical protein
MRHVITPTQINEFGERWYVEPDVPTDMPSSTTYLEVAPKGKAYDMFLQTMKNPEQVRDEAAQRGSATHGLIERTLKKETVHFEDLYDKDALTIWKNYLAWCKWMKKFISTHEVSWEPEDVERIVWDIDLLYAGTADWTPIVNGRRIVVDWKTGKSIWDTAYIQVSSYIKALEKMLGEPVNSGLIVQLGEELNKDGYRTYPIDNPDEHFEFFLIYQKIWWRAHKNEKPLFRAYPKSMSLEHIYNYNILLEGK